MRITHITPQFAVTGALLPEQIAQAAAMGFKAIISNLPDGESPQHPGSADEARLAAMAGLGFRHIPTTKHEVFSDRVVDGVEAAARDLEGPILAHCASGLRSAVAFAAAAARTQSAGCVLAVLKSAGFDLGAIREELDEQYGRSGAGTPAPLDCDCADPGPAAA